MDWSFSAEQEVFWRCQRKKIITVTSESQLAAKIVLHAFLHASYPEARSIGMMLIICRSSWLLLSKNENVKKGKKAEYNRGFVHWRLWSFQSEDRWCLSYFGEEGRNNECFFFLGLCIFTYSSLEEEEIKACNFP